MVKKDSEKNKKSSKVKEDKSSGFDTEMTMVQLKDMMKVIAKTEVEEKMNIIEQQNSQILLLQDKLKSVEKLADILHDENEKLKRKFERMEFEIHTKNEKTESMVEDFAEIIDRYEQENLQSTVKIVGLEEQENDKEAVEKIAKVLKVKIEATDLGQVYRLGKKKEGKKARDLVVSFKDKEQRNEFYQQRKHLSQKSRKLACYINENLTTRRSGLFYATRQLAKKKKIHSTWSQSGNIMIKITDSSQPVHVTGYKFLQETIGVDNEDNKEDAEDSQDTVSMDSEYLEYVYRLCDEEHRKSAQEAME